MNVMAVPMTQAVPPPPLPVHGDSGKCPEMLGRRRQRRGNGGGGGGGGKTAATMAVAPQRGMNQQVLAMERTSSDSDRMLHDFKTAPCSITSNSASHDHRCCPFYHSERDRRRVVNFSGSTQIRYLAEPCAKQFDDQRICEQGDACGLCHSTAELLYHPDFFRKRLCHQSRRCPRGRYCAFAHSRQELLVPHFTEAEEKDPPEEFIPSQFKTQWCPIGGPHDWESCVYAHTFRDWRRVPIVGYSSRPCPQWLQSINTGARELAYLERCPRGMACPMAHGAKEQLYHPKFYKTGPCSEANCKRGALCAFTHGPHDTKGKAEDGLVSQEPIESAEQILALHQPTYWNPPRYHALEEPPRGSFGYWGPGQGCNPTVGAEATGRARAAAQGSGGTSRRCRQRRSNAAWRQTNPAATTEAAAPVVGAMLGFEGSGSRSAVVADSHYSGNLQAPEAAMMMGGWAPLAGPNSMTSPQATGVGSTSPAALAAMANFAPYLCQMIPCPQPKPQLIPPSMGYSMGYSDNSNLDQWAASQYGGYGAMAWGSPPAALPPYALSLPGQQMPGQMMTGFALQEELLDALSRKKQSSQWADAKTAGKGNRIPWDRMRTPSSLGTPSPRMTPTVLRSPRQAKYSALGSPTDNSTAADACSSGHSDA